MTLIMTITTTVSCAKRMSLSKFSIILSFQLLMLVLGYDTNRLMFSSAMNMVGASSSINSNQHVPVTTCAIVGVGVLGTSLCNQLLRDPDLKDWKFTGITKSTTRHDQIMKEVLGPDDDDDGRYYSDRFELMTVDDGYDTIITNSNGRNEKFNHCIFCAPPSGFDDYPSAVRKAIDDLWCSDNERGTFIFTSSGGIYGDGSSNMAAADDDINNSNSDTPFIVTESSPLPKHPTPRIEKLINTEREVLKERNGIVIRLAGLYSLSRGAHNYWLGDTVDQTKTEIAGRSDSLINLLHYDDAAGSVVAALKRRLRPNHDDEESKEEEEEEKDDNDKSEIFLISDGHPVTRLQICESSLKNKRYENRTIPKFLGSKDNGDPIGKIYDESYTRKVLNNWKPRYESFDDFMTSSSSL